VIYTGIDIEGVERIVALCRKGRFLRRVFRDGELSRAFGKRRPERFLAGRFAAKEAFLKALGTGLSGGIRWKDVEVIETEGGRPEIALHGRAREVFGAGGRIFLDITCTGCTALALVLIEDGGND